MTEPSTEPEKAPPRGFRPIPFVRCLMVGHRFTTSRVRAGYMTCVRCRLRRPA